MGTGAGAIPDSPGVVFPERLFPDQQKAKIRMRMMNNQDVGWQAFSSNEDDIVREMTKDLAYKREFEVMFLVSGASPLVSHGSLFPGEACSFQPPIWELSKRALCACLEAHP